MKICIHLNSLVKIHEQNKHVPTLTAESTTAQFACWRRGVTLSTIFSASRASDALYLDKASKMNT